MQIIANNELNVETKTKQSSIRKWKRKRTVTVKQNKIVLTDI